MRLFFLFPPPPDHSAAFFQTAQLSDEPAVEYKVEVSLPQYFTLPTTVKIPMTQDDSVPWDNPSGETHVFSKSNVSSLTSDTGVLLFVLMDLNHRFCWMC